MIKEKTYLVLIKNLILKASVGIYPKEKIRKQKVRFNISISALDNIKKKMIYQNLFLMKMLSKMLNTLSIETIFH